MRKARMKAAMFVLPLAMSLAMALAMSLAMSLAMATAFAESFTPGTEAMASSYLDSGARILRAEYQGEELSKDRREPTVLEWTGGHVAIGLVGNPACAALSGADDVNIETRLTGYSADGGIEQFNADGVAAYYISLPMEMYVGNDVFEMFWLISCVTERTADQTTFSLIPGSESPVYYITFNMGEFNNAVPRGEIPAIVRAEFENAELSKDKNNPTKIPYFNNIKLFGNSVCKSSSVDVQIWHDGVWTRTGQAVKFNSSAFGPCQLSVAYETEGNNGSPLYNKTVKLEFAVHNDGYDDSSSKSPTYYVEYLDEESSLIDFGVSGLFQTIKLAEDRLVIEAKSEYIFEICNITLKDKTELKEYILDISNANPDCDGVMTNRITYSNLSLNAQNIYELEIPAKAAVRKAGMDPDSVNMLKYNRQYTTELIIEGSLSFPDVGSGHWAYPYVKELTEKRIIAGYEDGTFRPDGQVTRSEFAKIMALSLQIPLVDDATVQTFADVGAGNWAFAYVETVKRYLTGYSDGALYYFKGSEPAVREDMAVALVKAMGLENQDVELAELETIFSDYGSISPNLRNYVLIAYKNGLVDGYPDGTFRAQGTITRAEAAALLSKVYKSDAMEKVAF